jgi:hypothetical protein
MTLLTPLRVLQHVTPRRILPLLLVLASSDY